MAEYNSDLEKSSSYCDETEENCELICLPCHIDNQTNQAVGYCTDCEEHLCESCFTDHRRPAPCRHHRLQDRYSMPKTQQVHDSSMSIDAGLADCLTTVCLHHKREIIKLYCNDHDLPLCSICVTLMHAQCNVDYIPNISTDVVNGEELKDVMEKIVNLTKKSEDIKNETITDAAISDNTLEQALSDVKKYKEYIFKRIGALEKEIEDQIEALERQNKRRVERVETFHEELSNNLRSVQDNVGKLNSLRLPNKLFIELKKGQKQLEEFEHEIVSVASQARIHNCKFIPNQTIHNAIQTQNRIGDILRTNNVRIRNETRDIICVKTAEDTEECQITGIVALSPNKLVLNDFQNNSIKLVDVGNKTVKSQLSLGENFADKAWDMTQVTSTQVAVTLPFRQQIQFVSISNKLNLARSISTHGHCHGICCYQGKLIVSYIDPGQLEILDLNGNVITEMTTFSMCEYRFSYPNYVKATSEAIYVSDSDRNEVIKIDWKGNVVDIYEYFDGPEGLVSLNETCCIVCDYRGHMLKLISNDHNLNKVLLQDVKNPHAICVDDRQCKLYISLFPWDDPLSNNILVWDIETN